MSIPLTLRDQRSHVLFVLSEPADEGTGFLDWYRGPYQEALGADDRVLAVRRFELSDFDLTRGRHEPLPFHYLGIHDLSLDGAEEAEGLIDDIVEAHRTSGVAASWATWMSFPIGELAGTATPDAPFVTLAFANPVPGQDEEFREWYPTRHIRHALNIPALVSGRCHLRTGFQHASAEALDFEIVAVYEQSGRPEEVLDGLTGAPAGTFAFPAMDPVRFAESSYRRLE